MSDTSPDENTRNPFTRPGFIASGVLILVLVAAVVVIAFLPRNDEPGAATPSSSSSPSAPSSTTTATEEGTQESVCGIPGSDDTALGTAPESKWELMGTMAVPSAPETHGPGESTDTGVPFCFAQSPTGALYAAANIFASTMHGDPLSFYEQLVADSEARDEALAALAGEDQPSPSTDEQSFQIQGFQLDRYSNTSATVSLGFEIENGAVGSITLPLVWEEGDWKLLIEQSGAPEPRQLNDLSEFIPWSGV